MVSSGVMERSTFKTVFSSGAAAKLESVSSTQDDAPEVGRQVSTKKKLSGSEDRLNGGSYG